MSDVLERLRHDLTSHRADLVAERTTLARQLEEIDQAIAGIDQVLGGGRKQVAPARTVATAPDEKEQLRRRILEVLQAVHPAGLTSWELLERIRPEWTGSELTPRRIGANMNAMTELTSDGARWYFVPTDPKEDVLR